MEKFNQQMWDDLQKASEKIGAYSFRIDHLMEALERIALCDDLTTAKVIAQARIELCADWKSNRELAKDEHIQKSSQI